MRKDRASNKFIDSQPYKHNRRKIPIAFHSLSNFTLTTTQLNASFLKTLDYFKMIQRLVLSFCNLHGFLFKRDKNVGNFLLRSSWQTNDQPGTFRVSSVIDTKFKCKNCPVHCRMLTDHRITFNCTSNKLYSSGRKVFKKLPNVGQIGIESTIKFETTPNGFQDGQYHDKKVCSQALEKLVCWLIVWWAKVSRIVKFLEWSSNGWYVEYQEEC